MISIHATNAVAQTISNEQFAKAVEIAIEKLKKELFGEGIFASIKYLDSLY